MLRNNLKTRLRNRETTLGSWITLGHPAIAEIMCQAGYDWLTIDLEHSVITLEEAQQLIQVISLSGVSPLVRVSANDPVIIKRVMDAGAQGVIVPMVNSSEEAQQAVAAVKYPPVGKRGVGLARAQDYGFSFNDYSSWNADESIVIVQIEHIDAVHNLREILSVEGVDGFIVGPYDLSGSLGKPGRYDEEDVREALQVVEKTAKKMNALMGFHVVPVDFKLLEEKVAAGYQFLAHSLDTMWLGTGARESVTEFRNLTKQG